MTNRLEKRSLTDVAAIWLQDGTPCIEYHDGWHISYYILYFILYALPFTCNMEIFKSHTKQAGG